MRTNVKPPHTPAPRTHEGALAARITAEQALRRSVLSCLLGEREFYEDGEEIGARIFRLAQAVPTDTLVDLAVAARNVFNLRHAPLLLLCALAKRGGPIVGETVERVIQRADEPGELLALYWRGGKLPVPKQFKIGLGRALAKFDAYQLAKYDRAVMVRLRDVLFLTHAKPANDDQATLWRQLASKEGLPTPDTWEVALSAGADKRESFERLIRDGRLGYLALLRNLRNMSQAGVDEGLVHEAILARKGAGRVLPFRYVAAARAAPRFEPYLDQALLAAIADLPALPGRTVVMVDVSGSMRDPLSARSDLTRRDAAATLASIIPAEQLRVFTFADAVTEMPPRRGMAGVDAIAHAPSGGTRLFDAVASVNERVPYDRLVVITDEQAFGPARAGYEHSSLKACPPPRGLGYMINVASAQNGVGYGAWTHIDGFSEGVLRFIAEHERAQA